MSSLTIRTVQPLLRWFLDIGVSQFDLAVQRRDHAGLALQFLAPRFTLAQQLGLPDIKRRLAWLCAENAQGGDIYFRPFRHHAWPTLFLDDLPPAIALKVSAKYQAAVIETSPGSCHLWLALVSPCNELERATLQKDLVYRLQGAADPGSVSGDHWGRLPGFRNRKPGRDCWVNLLALSTARPYNPQPIFPVPLEPMDQQANCRGVINDRHDGQDMSRLEWGWVRGCLEQGVPSSWVLQQLTSRACHRRGSKDAARYARYTVNKACRILGLIPPH